MYPENPDCWKEHAVVRGKFNELVEANTQLGRPSWLSDEVRRPRDELHTVNNTDVMQEYATLRQHLLVDGTRGGLNWYVSQTHNNDLEDNLRKFYPCALSPPSNANGPPSRHS